MFCRRPRRHHRLIGLLVLFVVLFSGCQEETPNSDEKNVSKNLNARVDDESEYGLTDQEETNDDESDDPNRKRRRETYTPAIASPINEANARLYVQNYLALLKTATKDKPIDLPQKYKVAGQIDSGKFIHAFPDDHNEQVLLDLGFPIVREELDKEQTYSSKKAYDRWNNLQEKKKSAMGHLFLETLIRELHEMNSAVVQRN